MCNRVIADVTRVAGPERVFRAFTGQRKKTRVTMTKIGSRIPDDHSI
jgi:hypothetical protein